MTPKLLAIIIVATIGSVLGVLLGIRDLAFIASPRGQCIISVEPAVLIGFSPSFTAELDCA